MLGGLGMFIVALLGCWLWDRGHKTCGLLLGLWVLFSLFAAVAVLS